ncbi:ABC transporter substrate-binding protein [Dinghuibacter silviterrae]|uniref:Amino acid/amide ABC transporter substrate-binding protein (HAAT family) n=1 Tax=Dinghuibacter silviterrae TaxID=1539049 RepID=A0A4R8DXN7_9BACT|nr:ABC transporter substrate-binding protein [Dinghuibacter silviterrae]TDX01981.1 amino acid/amide ABC transporter substrate-binding protein (HAAT family) [Dinghuibacter silviterrae]
MRIGFLFPYSGIFPDLKNDFSQGFELALAQNAPQAKWSCLGEFIQNGDEKSVEGALKKLLHYERVDMVMGIVGNTVTAACIPMIESAQTPVIINNLGAHLPGRYLRSPYLFYNSLHLWKSEWAIGKWAQETYGGVPAVSLSLYEAGYHLLECFKNGIGAGGAENMTINVMRPSKEPVDTKPLIEYLEAQRPSYTHLLLSGNEAEQFVDYFDASSVRESVALTTHPFFGDSRGAAFATTWLPSLDNEKNQAFIKTYTDAYDTPPNVYALLGFEDGLALAATLEAIDGKPTRSRLAGFLGTVHPAGPRGAIKLSTQPLQAGQPVYLCRHDAVLETLVSPTLEEPGFEHLQGGATGWVNPYLCV